MDIPPEILELLDTDGDGSVNLQPGEAGRIDRAFAAPAPVRVSTPRLRLPLTHRVLPNAALPKITIRDLGQFFREFGSENINLVALVQEREWRGNANQVFESFRGRASDLADIPNILRGTSMGSLFALDRARSRSASGAVNPSSPVRRGSQVVMREPEPILESKDEDADDDLEQGKAEGREAAHNGGDTRSPMRGPDGQQMAVEM